ncbi:MAG: hypothetical protein QNJ98_06570 [Planctomycetota bacterium]|nr:hypothetical protein [Planctomycetota bacterium]
MGSLRIILLTMVCAVAYGLVHNQITIRLSYEYFTVAHPRWIDTDDPTVLALFWGVIATWWAGAIGGVVLALACRAGSLPTLDARALVRPLATALVVMGACAFAAALLGALVLPVSLADALFPSEVLSEVPVAQHKGLLTAGAAHNASYLVGAICVVWIAIRCRRRRRALASGVGGGHGAMDA